MTPEIEIHDKTLIFESIAAVPMGHSVSLSLEPDRKVQAQVEVCRPLENGNFLVLARSPEPLDALPSVDVAGSRSDVRVPERARVMSPMLANYSGLSVDFSLSGVQLELTGPVQVGDLLPLELTLSGAKEDLHCQAEVIWCQQDGDSGTHRAGCRFIEPDRELYDSLRAWLRAKLGRSLGFRSPRPSPPPQPAASPISAQPLDASRPGAEEPELHPRAESPQPIPLPQPIRPVTAVREEVSLQAVLRGYRVELDRIHIHLEHLDQRCSTIQVEGLWSLSDFRGRVGEEVAYLATQTSLERNVLRLVNPALEVLLELETRIEAAFEGAVRLGEILRVR